MLLKGASLLVAALLLGAASAGSSSTSGEATPTTSAVVQTHTVSVGADGLNFIPSQVNASVLDIIEFRFYPQNHSVAKAAYGQPCVPYQYTGGGRLGFWSGFFPLELVLSDPPKFQIQINDTEPLFFYCAAPNACLQGMIGVVNANSTQTFANQFMFTQNATEDFPPGDNPFPVEAAPTRTTTATGGLMTSTTTTNAPAATNSPAVATESKHGLGAGPIAGIAIAGFAALVLAIALIYMCGRQKTLNEILHRHSEASHTTYRPASTGLSEAQYPNIVKNPQTVSMLNSADASYATDGSYRSASPPIDERTRMNPAAWHGGETVSSMGPLSPNSPNSNMGAFPSPGYYDEGLHTHDSGVPRPFPTYNPNTDSVGPHELAAPHNTEPSPASPRPFSYTDSESGYRPPMNDEKIDSVLR